MVCGASREVLRRARALITRAPHQSTIEASGDVRKPLFKRTGAAHNRGQRTKPPHPGTGGCKGDRSMKHGPAFLLLAVGAALAALPEPTVAHHAFAAEFDANKPLTLTGTVTKVDWTNPHAWFYIDVRDDA